LLLGEPLKGLRVTEERRQWIVEALRDSHRDEVEFRRREVKRLEEEVEELDRKIDQLYEDKLSGVVPEKFWGRKFQEYTTRQTLLREKIENYARARSIYLDEGVRILELAQKAYSLYVGRNRFEQRRMLDLMVSNCTLQGGKVTGQLTELFEILANGAEEEEKMRSSGEPELAINKNWLPRLDSNRPLPGRVEKERSVSTHRELL